MTPNETTARQSEELDALRAKKHLSELERAKLIVLVFIELDRQSDEIKALREENAVLKSQVENYDVNIQQVRMNARSQWRAKVESAEATIATLTREREEQNGLQAKLDHQNFQFHAYRDSLAAQLEQAQKRITALDGENNKLAGQVAEVIAVNLTAQSQLEQERAKVRELEGKLEPDKEPQRKDWWKGITNNL